MNPLTPSSGSDDGVAAQGRTRVLVQGYDPTDSDVYVTADVIELWDRYGTELREDGMCGKPVDEIVRHVYEQNCDAPELEVEDA